MSPVSLYEGIKNGNRHELARAITLVESSKPEHKRIADDLLQSLEKLNRSAFRLGLTGPPGAGKSSFIECLGNIITKQEQKLAVLTIDPSSPNSGGSILGDKTRMGSLANNPSVFIRPSPTRGSLGGITLRTDRIISLFEAAGFNTIIIETVGVGQAETSLKDMVDKFILLTPPGGGDELQGIKRGIMELIDGIIITKSDLFDSTLIKTTQHEFIQTLHFLGKNDPFVKISSSTEGTGIEEIWKELYSIWKTTKNNISNDLDKKKRYFDTLVDLMIKDFIKQIPNVKSKLIALGEKVENGEIEPRQAADQFFKELGKLNE